MTANHEDINSAIRYWERMLDACCEAGSARDFLAINDLKLFMDEIARLREEVAQLNFLIEEASEDI